MPSMPVRGVIVMDRDAAADEAALSQLQAAGFIIVRTNPNRKFEILVFSDKLDCPDPA